MSRTTLDIDPAVLRELKRRAKHEGKSLGAVVSEIVAPALAARGRPSPPLPLVWRTRRMGPPRVELEDKEALRRVLDEP